MVGLVDEGVQLPNERFPSDHALVAAEVASGPEAL